MQSNPVNWFEIPVNDLDRAQKFYEATLEMKLDKQNMPDVEMSWFPMDPEKHGSTGTLVKAETYTPSHQGTMVYFPVADIDAALKRAEEAGGKTLRPKMDIGEYGFIAHFEDSEGNRIGLHQEK